jgi:chitinase
MNFKDIPAGALTHLYFSFGYVTPGDFKIAPMDGLSPALFRDLTDLKSENSGMQTIIALGGWTFTNPGTATQAVFSSICSTAENRATFIGNLLSFMREYAFDGVDFDWEYPGAPDRGGHPDDGKNFVSLLSELKEAISRQPIPYIVSFTVPTSYWYLRWFDLAAVDHVDWVNVMSYDLHGVWDQDNPIGNHVLAHTNLTEIKSALDLLWRSKLTSPDDLRSIYLTIIPGAESALSFIIEISACSNFMPRINANLPLRTDEVPAEKLNLGVGFYGRSFQLSDPSCFTPGCKFKGGASPGPCTDNSGTLSYREIMAIIEHHGLEAYHDKENAVKYITWNQDQWVSYDDKETFKTKIDYANSVGLGGLLIWSIDQDTDNLDALSALLEPKSLSSVRKEASNANFWRDATEPDCYVSDCGGSCKAGFISITKQPCGGATPVFRHSDQADSTLCCPLTAAPDPKTCIWRSDAPFCNGHCEDQEVLVQMNPWGDSTYCEDGNKAYCCQTSDHSNTCYWTGEGGDCNDGDTAFTFAGSFAETVDDFLNSFPSGLIGLALDEALNELDKSLTTRYCCPPAETKRWKNCAWHGAPGSCFDNHCDAGHQVQLTSSPYGQGENCFPHVERTRVFCCDVANGESPFSPVPLNYLFPSPPQGDDVDIDTTLKTDNTWGTGHDKTGDDEPNDSTFGFVVLASPQELQISLDKRDGSDWEVFNCNNAISEEAQTIQIYCGKSDTSDCDKIHLGKGVPGTILEMPAGCGPSRYAVAKEMVPSISQEFPSHLEKRTFSHRPTIYDLTFDFEWTRVPRDTGAETQMRLDYSNMEGYWDAIVDKPARRKKKRSLAEYNGNHKRWLEDEWRDDMHFGALDHADLHKRWFGNDVVSWLKGFFNPSIKTEITHDLQESYRAILIEEKWPCTIKGVKVDANLLVEAKVDVKVQTSFGITIIATLGPTISFKDSYLYFKNKGEASAVFSLDALGKVSFSKKDLELINLGSFPGATFGIPKLVTVGPNFRLLGGVEAEISLAGHIESRAQIASWNVQQTFPATNDEFKPKDIDPVSVDGTGDLQGLRMPTFDYSVTASGGLTAHLKPTIEFGIRFDPMWQVPDATVQLIADGSVTLHAEATTLNQNCPFTYGVDVGARLYVHVNAPSFGWNIPDFDLYPQITKSVFSGGSCPAKRDMLGLSMQALNHSIRAVSASYELQDAALIPAMGTIGQITKRSMTIGPPFHLPRVGCLFCPLDDSDLAADACSSLSGWEPGELSASESDNGQLGQRGQNVTPRDTHQLFERGKKIINFCAGQGTMSIVSPSYDSSGDIVKDTPMIPSYGYYKPDDCADFTFGKLAQVPTQTKDYATEHILEFQLLKLFFESLGDGNRIYDDPVGSTSKVFACQYLKPYWDKLPSRFYIVVDTMRARALDILTDAFPSTTHDTKEWVLLIKGVNQVKERVSMIDEIFSPIVFRLTFKFYRCGGARPSATIKRWADT